jgi:excisionase family DNA binding protein
VPEITAYNDRIFTVNEACRDHLRVSRGTFYKLVRERKLEVTRVAGRTLVTGRQIKKCRGELLPS